MTTTNMAKNEKVIEKKQQRINAIINSAEEALKAEGAQYFLCAIDKDPKAEDGGKMFLTSEIGDVELIHVIEGITQIKPELLPVIGIHVGRLINAKREDRKKN